MIFLRINNAYRLQRVINKINDLLKDLDGEADYIELLIGNLIEKNIDEKNKNLSKITF